MGCLKNIFRAVIIVLVIAGFVSLGGDKLVSSLIKNYFNPPRDVMLERAKKVGDFSNISDEFEIERAAGMFGYNAVVAEHKASGQKMIVVDEGKKDLITPQDIESPDVERKLQDALGKIKYSAVSVENITVTKRGTMTSYGRQVPYVRFDARIKKLPVGEVSGIISTVNGQDGNPRILISASEKAKYSQLISDEFFKQVK
ncbi:MAG: hypothetical protein LBJ74_02365 [Heliobacteriaceae bacterium]|jgi:hypothetical protein|nr:hypothetical protein [Heliobacteriaceae bacterium]